MVITKSYVRFGVEKKTRTGLVGVETSLAWQVYFSSPKSFILQYDTLAIFIGTVDGTNEPSNLVKP